MSAVTVAVIIGFVCCALLIRALGARRDARHVPGLVVDGDRSRVGEPGVFDVG
ncbi:hypothetical protein [Nocardia sp. CS682]|uniref:hypothetical protein n=1 Tax=Nocardia sp. CS682 TaxID=1047172 RepID=UPI00142FA766|nr:hypothetical protein [Nocardia sp. CS682]